MGVIYWFRLGFRYAARWRDLWVYALAVYYRVFTRRPFYLVEETILNRHSGNSNKFGQLFAHHLCATSLIGVFRNNAYGRAAKKS